VSARPKEEQMNRTFRALAVMIACIFATEAASVTSVAADATGPRRARVVRHHPHPPRIVRRAPARPRQELYGVSDAMFAAASRVAMCEEGGNWHFAGPVFDGGIGWTIANWRQFRLPDWPVWMHDAPPRMQANALYRFVRHYGMGLPDQDGVCRGY
jgi:hypothetical protein